MADGFTGKVLGAQLIEKRLTQIAKGARVGAARGIDLSAADLLQRSADLAPILTGDLIRSGRVRRARPSKSRFTAIVSYGTDHAIFTHFARYNLGPVSRTKAPTEDGPIGRLYLKRPFDRHAERYTRLVIDEAARTGRFRTSRR